MRLLTAGLHRLRSMLQLGRADRALDDELAFHLEMETARLVSAGMTPGAARAEALRSFGGVARHRDDARDARGISIIEDFFTDVRLGARAFRRQPGFAAVVVLTLGVGIATITSVFGTVYSVILAPLPYAEPDRIAVLWERNPRAGKERDETSPANFLDWQARARTFERIAASEPYSFDYAAQGDPVTISTALVTDGFFEILRIRPMLGRTLQTADFRPGAPAVVVFSERLWRTRFGGDPSIIGRTLVLDTLPRRVVGIMPASLDLPRGEDIWAAEIFDPMTRQTRSGNWLSVIGRLRDGVSLEQANADLRRLSADLAREYPTSNASAQTWAEPIETTLFGPVRASLYTLLGAAAFVLAIVCANTGALIVTRTMQRDRELAIRAALGAGRARLLRQIVAETAALALVGGTLGVILAVAGTAMIRRLAPPDLPRLDTIGLSFPVLAFCAGATIVTCLLAALTASGAIRRGGRALVGSPGTVGRRMQWSRPVLVGAESALALVLVVGAALLIRSFETLMHVDRGFSPEGVVTSTVQSWTYYPNGPARVAYGSDMLTRLRALPGVSAVGLTTSLPLSPPIGLATVRVRADGAPAGLEPRSFHAAVIAGEYFDAMRIPLREGRQFTSADAGDHYVVIVSESFARQLFPDGHVIGRRVTFGFSNRPLSREIVGIVGDVRQRSLEADPIASVYLPHAQAPSGAMTFVVRGENAAALAPLVRKTLTDANRTMPLEPTVPFTTHVDSAIRERRFHLALLSTFAAVALGLAMLGIYGVTNQAATERTREIGLRVAVGATGRDITQLILRQGTVIVGVGVAVGVAASVALTRLLRALLFGVTPLDPIAFGAGIGLLFVLAVVASWIPARRASAIDPVRALRAD
jgi:predicted permease